VLLDGASSPDPGPLDGAWYAERLGRELAARLGRSRSGDLRSILADAIGALARDYNLVAGRAPSSTVAIVRWVNDRFDTLLLGDSVIVGIQRDGRTDELHDDRLADVAIAQRHAYRDRLRSGGGYDDIHQQLLRAVVAEERQARNSPDGYSIAEADPKAAYDALIRTWPCSDFQAVILASDGASAGVMRYDVFSSWKELLNVAMTSGGDDVLRLVSEAEELDAAGKRWPRSKMQDDKTLAIVVL
jgi:hypothetical protein